MDSTGTPNLITFDDSWLDSPAKEGDTELIPNQIQEANILRRSVALARSVQKIINTDEFKQLHDYFTRRKQLLLAEVEFNLSYAKPLSDKQKADLYAIQYFFDAVKDIISDGNAAANYLNEYKSQVTPTKTNN